MFTIKYRVSSVPLFTLQTESQIMKLNLRRQFAQVALFSLMALGAGSAFAQTERPASSGPGMSISPAQFEKVDLREASQASQDVSRFLAQPKLAEALAKANSDKSAGGEAAQNGNSYLAKQGVQVPGNMTVQIKPSASGGVASKPKVKVEVECCPVKVVIIITF